MDNKNRFIDPYFLGYRQHQKTNTLKKFLFLFSSLFLIPSLSVAQGRLQITVQDGSSTTTCGDLFGAPDPRFSVNINNDNWVTYPATNFCFTDFPNMQYEAFFNCPSEVPATINLCLRVFEDDGNFCNLNEDCMVEVCQDYAIPSIGNSIDYNMQVIDGLASDGELNFTVALDGSFAGGENDLICDALDLGDLPFMGQIGNPLISNYNNYCGTNSNDPSGQNFTNNNGVWFTFQTGTDPSAMNYINGFNDPEGLGDNFRLEVALFESTDGTCNNVDYIASASNNTTLDQILKAHCLAPNTRYFIMVNGAGGEDGYFGLQVVAAGIIEAADRRCDAEDLGMVPTGGSVGTPLNQTNYCGTNFLESNPTTFDVQRAVWFSFQAPETGHVTIDLISDLPPPLGIDPIDLQAAIYSSNNNSCIGAFTEINSQYNAGDYNESIEVQCLVPGDNYWVVIDGSAFDPEDTHGVFGITVTDAGPVAPQSTTMLDEIICSGAGLQVGDSLYTQSGPIEEVILAANGCDSLVIGSLLVLPPNTTTIDTTICNGESVTVGNSVYFESGNYTDLFTSTQSCDSIIYTNVTVLENVDAVAFQVQEASSISANDGIATVTVTGGIAPYTYLWSNGGTTETINDLIPGLYCVTVTAANGCEDITCISVLYPGAISVEVQNGEVTCNGDSDGILTLTVSDGMPAYNYEWGTDFGAAQGSGVINNAGVSATISNLAPGSNYTITVTDGDGLIIVTFGEITEPIPIVNNLDTVLCFGESLTVGSTIYNTSGAILENLTSPAGCDSLVTGTLVVLPENTTTLNLTECFGTVITVGNVDYSTTGPINEVLTAANGCDSTVTGFLTILPEIVTSLDTTVCFGESVVSGGAIYTASGTYSDTLVAANSCDSIVNTTLIVLDELLVTTSIVAQASGLGDADGVAQAIAIGGDGFYTYNWSNGGAGGAISNLTGGETYCVTVTDTQGCTAESCIVVLFPVDIQSTFENDTLSCPNAMDGSLNFTAFNGQAPYGYTWQNANNSLNGAGVILNEGDQATINNLPAGTYTILLADVWGTGSFVIEIVEPDPIVVELQDVTEASCFGECNGALTVRIIGGEAPFTYQWSNSSSTSALAENLCAGNYDLTVTDVNGCSATWNGLVTEPEEFIIEAFETNPVSCNDGNDGIATITTNGTPINILWSTGATTAEVENLTAGIYTVTVTNSDNCTAETSIQINEPLSAITSVISIDQEITCNGAADATLSISASGGTDFTFTWSNGMTGAILENLGPGTYAVTIEDGNLCTAFDEIILQEPTPITADVSTTEVNCFNGANSGAILIENVMGGGGTYLYSLDGFVFYNASEFSNVAAGDYEVYIQDDQGCVASFPALVEAPGEIEVDLRDDFTMTLGETLELDVFTTSDDPVYQWSVDSCAACPSILINPLTTTQYAVTVTDAISGCTESDVVTVSVDNKRNVFIPNVFSPNFDGENDDFIIYSGPSVATIRSFQVFSRWGGLVFEARDIPQGAEVGWDGTINGKEAPDGVYVYLADIVFVDGLERLYRGSVTVVR